ncbi:hypothetical protein [uncultured Thioclava sp.]|uniref:hypothetical protein n=1 Tax=uncultured Thioclava sp. TaxID=473858 RepID=UPI0025EAE53C|nr:hypothetical protein [uncultured Thioclava sp.]
MTNSGTVLVMGSAPNVTTCRDWPKSYFSAIIAINNAWRVRDDWDFQVAPDDFPKDRLPQALRDRQRLIGSASYVPANNDFGGIIYAGATMVFSAGYWALAELRPKTMVFVGCDMVYPTRGMTHFYGSGTPDPLREDVTLRNLEAKSARLMAHAARQGCACVRPDGGESRLLFPTVTLEEIAQGAVGTFLPDPDAFLQVKAREQALGYFVKSGRYWESPDALNVTDVDAIDQMWAQLCTRSAPQHRPLSA